jgi:toxin HigB-1
VIRSFRNAETEQIFKGIHSKKFANIQKAALRKLFQLHAAKALSDLKGVGNALEQLVADRKGQTAIRINDQYRICFAWKDGDAYDVEITDYH